MYARLNGLGGHGTPYGISPAISMTSPTQPPQAGAQVQLPHGSEAVSLILGRVRAILAQIDGDPLIIRDFSRQTDRIDTQLRDSGGMGVFGLNRQADLLATQVGHYVSALANEGVSPRNPFGVGLSGLGAEGGYSTWNPPEGFEKPPPEIRLPVVLGVLGAAGALWWLLTPKSKRAFRGVKPRWR